MHTTCGEYILHPTSSYNSPGAYYRNICTVGGIVHPALKHSIQVGKGWCKITSALKQIDQHAIEPWTTGLSNSGKTIFQATMSLPPSPPPKHTHT